MLANIVEKWCLRGWYKNQKIPDLCGGAEQLLSTLDVDSLYFLTSLCSIIKYGALIISIVAGLSFLSPCALCKYRSG
ncbi:hypothetical protein [Endozoicomonas sp. SCSIO W0465]|uniref:hypothetical protein n=1 Tax=Endozoicomonas sp. SCSIO W0465 TaxID=2918516 RepID=UPI002074EE6A|nr:hypothetical protein [Endozoicomonas sp. SCSIO W0465]USE36864.1 hypothetical protein MJO57_01055 [Endozoicomonas sp. SCSIO W0465]